ncbi:MAG: hypothetical protein ACLFWD_13510 [Anaerolineales bacterium]
MKLRIATMIVVMFAIAGCGLVGAEPLGEAGQNATVVGEVRSVDLSPMAYDGPAEIVIQSEAYGEVKVLVSPCFGDCARQAVEQLEVIEAGQQWQATGEVQEDGRLGIFIEGEHFLQSVDG